MRRFPRPIQYYILLVMVSGGLVLVAGLPYQMNGPDLIVFAVLAMAGIMAGVYRLPLANRHGKINLTGGILLMAVFLTTPSVACTLSAVVAAVSGTILRRRLWNTLFMVGTNVLSVGAAAIFYRGIADNGGPPLDSWTNVVALYASASSYWLINSAMVTALVAARNRERYWPTYVANWREVYLQCILLTLLAVLGAGAWYQGPVYAALISVPVVAVYQLLSITKSKQEQVVKALEIIGEVVDRRNPITFQHSRRVAVHTVRLARALGLTEEDVDILRLAALIHDIGKLGVDDPYDETLPARHLTDYQFYSLKQHALLGAMIAREIPAFEESEEPIRYHHDWFDGSHTSKEHAGEEIPLGARILAVADSYDHLCIANGEATEASDPLAIQQLQAMSGKQLDPQVLACFLSQMSAAGAASQSQSAALGIQS